MHANRQQCVQSSSQKGTSSRYRSSKRCQFQERSFRQFSSHYIKSWKKGTSSSYSSSKRCQLPSSRNVRSLNQFLERGQCASTEGTLHWIFQKSKPSLLVGLMALFSTSHLQIRENKMPEIRDSEQNIEGAMKYSTAHIPLQQTWNYR